MSKRKSTTQSSQSSLSTTTPINPDWVQHTAQSLNQGVQRIGGLDPYSLVAPVSSLETQAAQGASSLGKGFGGGGVDAVGGDAWFAKLLSGPTPAASSASLLDNLQAYYNPFKDQVTSAAMADFDVDAGRTRAAQDLALAGAAAFGGSGAALTQSMTEGEMARARNSQLSKLLSEMFTTSAGLAGQDAQRRQDASIANAQLAQADNQWRSQTALARDDSARSNVAAQAALGAQLRGVDQATRSAPLSLLGSQIDMFSGLPLSLFQGQTTGSSGTGSSKSTQTGSVLDTLSQLAGIGQSIAGMKLSDRRLKRDIHRLGERADGLGVYLYRYLWSPLWQIGVMAQEVLKVTPQAVVRHPSGFLMVDYSKLGA